MEASLYSNAEMNVKLYHIIFFLHFLQGQDESIFAIKVGITEYDSNNPDERDDCSKVTFGSA